MVSMPLPARDKINMSLKAGTVRLTHAIGNPERQYISASADRDRKGLDGKPFLNATNNPSIIRKQK